LTADESGKLLRASVEIARRMPGLKRKDREKQACFCELLLPLANLLAPSAKGLAARTLEPIRSGALHVASLTLS
jgi:hypothetical protein